MATDQEEKVLAVKHGVNTVDHHDASRRQVSVTALGVAALRAMETEKGPKLALVEDPHALALVGPAMEQFRQFFAQQDLDDWINFLAVRTKFIDDWLADKRPKQLVILGAGLDTRAYRLQSLRDIPVFEVDFANVLKAKRDILKDAKLVSHRLYDVGADMAVDAWDVYLCNAGFDSRIPTCWLLEGLTGYLTEAELEVLLQKIAGVSASESLLLATFIGEAAAQSGTVTSMHRYLPKKDSEAVELLHRTGWQGIQARSINDIGAHYNRDLSRNGYWIIDAAVHRSRL